MPTTKPQLRTEMKSRRAGMSAQEVLRASESIRGRVLGVDQVCEAERIFVYVSAHHEPDTLGLVRDLLADGKRVSVPRIDGNNHIQPHLIADLNDLQPGGPGQFNLPVPPPDSPIESLPGPAVTLLPGLAFTRTGQRLGMGGGHYDRFIADHPATLAVALCYDWQILEDLPTEPHDQRVKMLVTESGVVSCG